jgi:hypothetical protein
LAIGEKMQNIEYNNTRMSNFVITKLKMEGSLKAERNITKFTK